MSAKPEQKKAEAPAKELPDTGDSVASLRQRLGETSAMCEALQAEVRRLEEASAEAGANETALQEQMDRTERLQAELAQAHADVERLDATVTEVTAERDALKRQVAAQKANVTKTRNQLATVIAEYTPRAIGPLDADGDDEPLSAADLLALAQAARRIELAFSDGKQESAPPVVLAANAVRAKRGQLHLNVPSLLVHGPEQGQPARTIAGFALFLDDEQAAWSPRYEPLRIAAGQTVEMAAEVIF